ncbi:uncharacterized protein [Elaeis guineensis]|uniref:Uncharacterized protein LOC105040136 n=1 Tax=Elaeis guineensis var. tenera TaxID=51953 RepID=A0A6I9QT46_ELAGV|nr:uncharacterized protein LOC105040136 [Elaeis guineensis]XP_029118862.1 uncharacterized protein LOC105040136 [Elaeis guineensis]XP_029118863.1 uncharacterized protein LOC105040136 [Elaeis guineensis]
MDVLHKRMKLTEEAGGEKGGGEVAVDETTNMAAVAGSEEMELNIQRILEKIDHFTQQVSDLLEAVRTLFKDLSNEFEERLIAVHREQMDKWQEEINELRLQDASNEAARTLLQNAQDHLLQNVREDS